MNQARSIYQTDYVPFDWVENNFAPETDFCSSENIDECLRLISQEFCALGYPSIYSSSTPCDYAVNCDIVKLLNVTFELIGNYRDHAQVRDDLECRNRRLFSDLNALSKKNSQLKENLEQAENRYKAAIEKERQMKEKNNRLMQTIKNEKEESKKLSSQIQQQKVTYQHEIRKYENNMNQMKARLNQILADKNPDKKIANISPSSLLQRNSKQRGKWKTGSVAKSCVEEMYSSVISSYENRCQTVMKEILEYQNGLEYIQRQIIETLSFFSGNPDELNLLPLSVALNSSDLKKVLEERFQYLFNKLKETVLENIKNNTKKHGEDLAVLISKISQYEKSQEDSEISEQATSNEENITTSNGEKDVCSETLNLDAQKKQLETEREGLKKEKLELSATAAFIEQEKTNLAMQKLDLIKLAIQQESSKSHLPDQQNASLTPLWEIGYREAIQEKKSRSELTMQASNRKSPSIMPSMNEHKNTDDENSNLPKWAVAAITSPTISSESHGEGPGCAAIVLNATSSEELELSNVSSAEQNLDLLKAAMEDIESRRNHLSM
ncbi:afadin-and alpha-actinin-binding protein [Trichonephila inaurata madagascariensis]|uniref:Afadin-and alpha-actinin-binding protein n=1 Tax=Trichonephila inaurata madagascariensis TaxID=2747483 RepID=A0A8X7BZJ0_9ARAC|nr:afadin-and alpha-actinin-binding protein [Trichonephila inaurata madagascariensis]